MPTNLPPEPAESSTDDVWDDSPMDQHPSDMPRLEQEHATAGYRDGLTAAKAKSAQGGFDEGFGLGATLGLRVGRVLGLLEGLVMALGDSQDAADANILLDEAQRDLNLREVYAAKYWAADGTWLYRVSPGDGGDKTDGQVVYQDVAAAHPLIRKWEAIMEREIEKWALDEKILDGEHWARDIDVEAKAQEVKAPPKERDGLAW